MPKLPKLPTGRNNSIAAGVLTVLLVTTAVIAAIRTDGYRASQVDLNDAAVWISGDQISVGGSPFAAIGRVNTEVSQINVTVPGKEGSRLVQNGNFAAYVNGATLSVVDPASTTVKPAPLATDVAVAVGGGSVAALATNGKLWLAANDQLTQLGKGVPEVAQVDKESLLVVGDDGVAYTYRPGESKGYAVTPSGSRSTWKVAAKVRGGASPSSVDAATTPSPVQLSVVDATPVVLDTAGRTLSIGSHAVSLPASLGEVALQQPGAGVDGAVLATRAGLHQVSLGSGKITALRPTGPDAKKPLPPGALGPIRPVVVQGCAYGAWETDHRLMRVCPDAPEFDVSSGVEGWADASATVFRVNHDRVVLNETISGDAFQLDDNKVRRITGWSDTKRKDETREHQQTGEIKDPNPTKDCTKGQGEKVKATDVAAGARVGVPATVSLGQIPGMVAPDCGVLRLTKATVPAATGQAVVAGSGDAVQFTPSKVGTAALTYVVDDGIAGHEPASATVTFTVHPNNATGNKAPDLKEKRRQPTIAVPGALMSYNPLLTATDPEGDTMSVVDACIGPVSCLSDTPGSTGARSTDNGSVQFEANGWIRFRPVPGKTGPQTLSFLVADSYGAASKGSVRVQVKDGANLAPVTHADRASVVTGQPANVNLLDNDVSPAGRTLSIKNFEVTSSPNVAAARAALSPDKDNVGLDVLPKMPKGTTIVKYKVTDGKDAEGVLRLTVGDGANLPPVAMRDEAVAAGAKPVLVDVVANDFDPGGDVLVVASATAEDSGEGGEVNVQILNDRHNLRVTPPSTFGRDGAAPVIVNYEVSNGARSASGTLVLSRYPSSDRAPFTQDDGPVEMAPGGVVHIPVLANDLDPEGAPLRVAKVTPPDRLEDGTAFIQGDGVNFVAPANHKGGVVSFSYAASDAPLGMNGNVTDAQVTVMIRPDLTNRPPEALALTAAAIQDGDPVVIRVPLLSADPDGDIVGITGVTTAPKKGSVELIGDGFLYTPGAGPGALGTDTFEFMLTDGVNYQNSTVRVGVIPAQPDAGPSATPITITLGPGQSRVIDLLDAEHVTSTAGNLAVSASKGEAPKANIGRMSKVSSTFTVDYTAPKSLGPDADRLSDVIDYVITDGSGKSARNQVNITIDPKMKPLAPIATDDFAVQVRSGKQAQVRVLANDADPTTGTTKGLKITPIAAPAGAKWSDDGTVRFTMPNRSTRFRYRITNPASDLSAEAVVSVPLNGGVDCPTSPIDMKAKSVKTLDVLAECDGPPGAGLNLSSDVTFDNPAGSASVADQKLTLKLAASQAGRYKLGYSVCIAKVCDRTNVVVSRDVVVDGKNSPPTMTDRTLEVSADSERTLDLRPLSADENPGDKDNLRYTLTSADTSEGVHATVSPTGLLTVKASSDSYRKGAGRGTLKIGLDDGHRADNKGSGTVTVKITEAESGSATAVDDSPPRIIQATTAKTTAIDVLANDVRRSADGKAKIEIASVAQPSNRGGQAKANADRSKIEFTTSNTDFGGVTTFTYSIHDPDQPDNNRFRSTATVSVHVVGPPAQPGVPQPTPVQSDPHSIRLQWAPADGNGGSVDSYEVECRIDGGGSCPTSRLITSGTSLAFAPLRGNGTYQFRVRAHNEAGWGRSPNAGWSDWSAATMTVPSPPRITKVGFFDGSCDQSSCPSPGGRDGVGRQLTVTWKPAPDDIGASPTYKVHVVGGGVYDAGTATTYTVAGLANGTGYRVWVSATNRSSQNPTDATGAVTAWTSVTPATVPDAPYGLTFDKGDERITVHWQIPNNGGDAISGYIVTASSPGNPTIEPLEINNPSKTSAPIAGTVNGESYRIEVRAKNKSGRSAPGWVDGTSEGAPDRVTSGSARPGDSPAGGDIVLTFTQPNVRGSNVNRYIVSGAGPDQIVTPSPSSVGSNSSVTLTLTGLTNGTAYGPFTVRGCNTSYGGSNNTSGSPECSADSPTFGSPGGPGMSAGQVIPFAAPTNMSVSGGWTGNKIRWTWSATAPAGAESTSASLSGGGLSGTAPLNGSRTTGDFGCGAQSSKTLTVTFEATSQGLTKPNQGSGPSGPKPNSCRIASHVNDYYYGGTWERNSTSDGTWYISTNKPPGAGTFLVNGTAITLRCTTPGASYRVNNNGNLETWSWWAQETNGYWVPVAVIDQGSTDGDSGLPHC